ncbi:GNAT family N-acetyltransferase [Synechococcus sp. Nb3U1]|uniref:GNAT family N-acetyltransferase n=1 Tax=Synechococcus sp. Nb3U1 TaxID=1914529 RepID=UPI001F2F98CA|nr:GNAT family N-acetyltransferase [Synechococcus sp. Nb3U1]MCF2970881.1 GNAT family N-acetyltransferase [Synechococcus sp. Nb3U1]
MPEQGIPLPPGYRWRIGSAWDRPRIRQGLQATLQESFPEQTNWDHLEATLDRLFDPPHTPCWWILKEETAEPVGCVWVGISTDQATYQRVAYIFLLWVDPAHRRQGLGKALIQQVEQWGSQQQLAAITLQVYHHNQAALSLYQQADFTVQGYWLHKSLGLAPPKNHEVL